MNGSNGARERLIVASNNANKLKEFEAILGGRYQIVSMQEAGIDADIEENGTTFEENALIKANTLMQLTGCATLADDSGLCVDALGGRPGVHSARYCGVHGDDEANNQLLLKELEEVAEPRTARYECAVALCAPGREDVVGEGACEGEILRQYQGEGGFGYDPLFLCETGETFAEIGMEQKNRISHRKRGIEAVLRALDGEEQA